MSQIHPKRCRSQQEHQIGERFGRLTIIGPCILMPRSDGMGRGRPHYPCRCDCGNEKLVEFNWLARGAMLSCGCLHRERRIAAITKHGWSRTKLYKSWRCVLMRCYDLRHPNYKHYGGRGITVYPEWRNDFVAFRDWALANGYREGLSIERKDVNGNYEPSNCCWIPFSQQSANRRTRRVFTAFGETKSVMEWTRDPRCRISHSALMGRIKRGWQPERAVTEPLKFT